MCVAKVYQGYNMPLLKIKDLDPNYRETFGGNDLKGNSVYSDSSDEKIGTVDDILVDENGQFRYLVVDLGFWIFGKKVLLPIGRARLDSDRVYALGLTRDQAERLPEYKEGMTTDYGYEEQVRGVYRPAAGGTASGERDMPLEGTAPLEASGTLDPAYSAPMAGSNPTMASSAVDPLATSSIADPLMTSPAVDPAMTGYATTGTAYDRDTYSYDRDPDLYALNEQDHQTLRLYEERLVASKTRMKTGEVAVGKRVETQTEQVSVPIEKERVVIERTTPVDSGTPVSPGEVNFQEGEVARMEIYEETPDIHKEAVVREEVTIRKEVDREVVNAEETVRREELDIDSEGRTIEERPGGRINDPI